eukprot:TRINITY_DN4007_c0_g1_i1.p1 TRINITY_DN4007_c0_g1~~TRINITY_DN4007_c0_g1_i1.p1  ORF type:complete len:299 (-),score=38.86 TRINITY_DN4007_c0_g1_i1:67-963(-)
MTTNTHGRCPGCNKHKIVKTQYKTKKPICESCRVHWSTYCLLPSHRTCRKCFLLQQAGAEYPKVAVQRLIAPTYDPSNDPNPHRTTTHNPPNIRIVLLSQPDFRKRYQQQYSHSAYLNTFAWALFERRSENDLQLSRRYAELSIEQRIIEGAEERLIAISEYCLGLILFDLGETDAAIEKLHQALRMRLRFENNRWLIHLNVVNLARRLLDLINASFFSDRRIQTRFIDWFKEAVYQMGNLYERGELSQEEIENYAKEYFPAFQSVDVCPTCNIVFINVPCSCPKWMNDDVLLYRFSF